MDSFGSVDAIKEPRGFIRILQLDFLSSSFVVLLWFLASVVWASGVDQLKRYTSEHVLSKEFCEGLPSCHVETLQTYAGLNISLVFGFANIALWASSLWFLWKETPWHQGNGSDLLEDSALPAVDGAPL
ncbi:cellular calcium ion homeostasis [Sparganum proliferum]